MTVRFFILQAHYRSTLDFSNEALQAAEKGLDRLMKGIEALHKAPVSATSSFNVDEIESRCAEAMADDLNSPIVISTMFDYVRLFNQLSEGKQTLTAEDKAKAEATVQRWVFDILGLENEKAEATGGKDMVSPLVTMLLDMRMQAKADKNWALSDEIRDKLTAIGIRVKDRKDGYDWEIE
jgi:cysteinyl-tRNA synthetase